jgi:hypothetical protein
VFGSWPDPYNTNDVKNLHNAFSYGTVHKEDTFISKYK